MQRPYRTITLRLNADEYAHLKKMTAITGLKMEPVLRKLITGEKLHPRPPYTYPALLHELSAIGNNINQIARIANGKKDVSPAEVDEAVRLTRQAWNLVKEAF